MNNLDNITEGDNITITCESIGNPLPTVIWSRTNRARVIVGNYTESQNASKVSRNLTITNASREDTGVYTCSANNSVGSVSSNVSITVQCKFVLSSVLCSWGLFIMFIQFQQKSLMR